MTARSNICEKEETPPLNKLICTALASIWFPHQIKSFASVRDRSDLAPSAALCLLIMVTEDASSSSDIEIHLAPFGGGNFSRVEAKIIAEDGLYSLRSNGYIRLDAKGEQEKAAHDTTNYGLGNIQWLLTAKGARAMAPIYCSCKGLDSSEQASAVKAMLAANKATVSKNRKRLKSS